VTILRDYQRQAVDAFWQALTPDVNRVAIEMATGLGKTLVIGAVADEWLDQGPRGESIPPPWGKRVLVLAERDELIRQAVEKIKVITRDRWTIGVVKAGQDETDADIVVASVATLRQPGRKERVQDVGLIIIDECHHSTAQTYVDILEHFGALPCEECRDANEQVSQDEGRPLSGNYCPNTGCATMGPPIPVLGVTATLARSDGAGLGQIFQDMPFSRDLLWGIRKGFLTDLVPYTIKIPEVDASASDAVLDTVLSEGIAPEAVVDAWFQEARYAGGDPGICDGCEERTGSNRSAGCEGCTEHTFETMIGAPSTVLFAPLVRSAEAFAEAFNAAGVKAEVVAGAYGDAHNEAVEARFRAGTTTVVCNAMKWTEGLDIPRISCVIIARPTQRVPLLIQMAGRGLRPWLDAQAPPREEQRCILMCVQGTGTDLATVADLSDKIAEVQDGKSLLEMEDEWDIGKGIEDAPELYAGPVRVEQWDTLVRNSSKAWNYTEDGTPFLPTAKNRQGYVFVVERPDGWTVWAREATGYLRPALVSRVATAPDLELAMAIAEDECLERGGDLGALLADKSRAWRKAVPSEDMQTHAARLGLVRELTKIMAQAAGGKAGRLSDLISKREATIVLDRVVTKIKTKDVVPPA
jgi:superfamily II DNA or RNA helicase